MKVSPPTDAEAEAPLKKMITLDATILHFAHSLSLSLSLSLSAASASHSPPLSSSPSPF